MISVRSPKEVKLNEETKVNKRKKNKRLLVEIFAVIIAGLFFGIPFYFVIINSFKSSAGAAEMSLSWPETFHFLENYKEVLMLSDGLMLRAFFNSTTITIFSVTILIFICSMAGFVIQRRRGISKKFHYLILLGLMIPPAIVPTIWVLQSLNLFKTLPGIVLLESSLHFSFACLLYTAFLATIPREIDEAAIIDGCGPFNLYFRIIFPLLKPVSSTIIVIS